MDKNKIWGSILNSLKDNTTNLSYTTWISPLYIHHIEENSGIIYLAWPNEAKLVTFLNDHYLKLIENTVNNIMEKEYRVIIKQEKEYEVSKIDTSKMKSTLNQEKLFNPRFNFDSFVVGNSNKYAHAVSVAVAETPGDIYNPLFIYGGAGLGKTHLMHAIGNYIIDRDNTQRVVYVTSESFVNEIVEAIRDKKGDGSNSMQEFRNKYRNVDVLLIDDIQFIIGKETMQQEFFHTFNHLYESQKQIVISSDKHPATMKTLEERLRSRFEMGLTVDIKPPTYETRMAILRRKVQEENLSIDDSILDFIASNVSSNIRELQGAITKVIAFSKLRHNDITMDLAKQALSDMIAPDKKKEITIDYIIETVADHFNISTNDLLSSKRSSNISHPRQICMYLCCELTNNTLDVIKKHLNRKDHSTIIHGRDNIKKLLEDTDANPKVAKDIDILIKKINPQ